MSTFHDIGVHVPKLCIEVDATTDPTSSTRTWTDITALIRGAGWTRGGRNMELNRSTAGGFDAVCSDKDGAITNLGLRKRQWLRVQAQWNAITYPRWQGILELIPRRWPGQGSDELVELRAAGAFKVLGFTDLAGETFATQRNDQRVSAIIALANLAIGTIDTSTDTADAVTDPFADESFALDYLLQIEESENGLLVENPDGSISFQGRRFRFTNSGTSLGTFGENTAAGEILYFDDVELDDDDALVANVIRVTPYGATVPVEVINSASTAKYWPTAFDRQLLSSSTPLAQSAAEYLSERYGDPSPRIPAIRTELAAIATLPSGTANVAALLSANNSDRFTWKRNAATPIDDDVYVEQIAETVQAEGGSWEIALQLSPAADEIGWVLGTSQLGITTGLLY